MAKVLYYTATFLSLPFSHLFFIGGFNLISISGKKKKTGSYPSSWLLLSFSWQREPKVSIEEVGRDTTHSEFMKDLIYHQSESFQILQSCFLMLLGL
jgi:hypothetical protein